MYPWDRVEALTDTTLRMIHEAYLYLKGFRKILEMKGRDVNLDNLFLGKTTHTHLTILNELVDRGILNAPTYRCHSFEEPVEMDPILKYLTDSLK